MTEAGPRILIIDDEPQIHRFLRPSMSASGFTLFEAMTAAEGLKLAAGQAPDIILLDLGLPDMDGKEVIAKLREWTQTPIIVLSARNREAEKILSLDAGADDYVNKPFGIGELIARIRAALRHRLQREGHLPVMQLGDLKIDLIRHSIMRSGDPIHLSPKEFLIFELLTRHVGSVVTHKQILDAAWGLSHHGDTQYLRIYIGQLRNKIELDPQQPRYIMTEPGIGYRLSDAESKM